MLACAPRLTSSIAKKAGSPSGAIARYRTEGGARNYARKYGASWTRRGTSWRETRILEWMLAQFDPAASLLNVPCGAGRFAETIAPGPRRRVVFADLSQAMLDAARVALAAAGAGPVDFCLADLTKGAPEGRFDVVLCVRLLHHLERSEDFEGALDNLVKGASLGIICTFASSSTWKGWWRLRRRGRRSTEALRTPEAMARAFAARGWRVSAARRVTFFFSTQTWLLLVPESR